MWWDTFIHLVSGWSFYTVAFPIFTLLALLSRRSLKPDWSKDSLASGASNLSLIALQAFCGGFFMLLLWPVVITMEWLPIPRIGTEFWDMVPLPVTVIVLLLAYDFVIYWTHRWMHTGVLWPLHAIHHSDTHMHYLTWGRSHPLETVVISGAAYVSLYAMGISVVDILAAQIFRQLHQTYVHANIDWGHGPFRKVLTSPQLHRWHHVDDEAAYDKNFASIFPVYDVLFGTYYYPGSAVDMPTGFEGAPGHNPVDLFFYPFREWGKREGVKRVFNTVTKRHLKASATR